MTLPLLIAAPFSGGLINLLIWLLVFAVVTLIVFWILGMFTLPQPARNIITAIVALIFLLVLLNRIGFLL